VLYGIINHTPSPADLKFHMVAVSKRYPARVYLARVYLARV
jgi:hypothetical protein